MPPSETHRRRVTLKRRRRKQAEISASEQAAQERARLQRQFNRELRGWSPRRICSWALIGFAVLVAINHMFAHLGSAWLPISLGWQDLLAGYPMAGVLALIGFIILGQNPRGTAK